MKYYEIIYETVDFEDNAICESATVVSENIKNALECFLGNNEITIDEIVSVSFDSIIHD
jgi:hypothetical protein